MNLKARINLFSVALLISLGTVAQPFAKEIAAFKKADSISFPPKNAILFIGSSSFTMWKDVQSYFPTHNIVNRGFGGSSLTDLLFYEKEVIFPYHPRQILIYCGENDIAGSDTVTGEMVYDRFRELFSHIRAIYPKVHIGYVSMKPSPSRAHLLKKYVIGNELIRSFLKKQKRTAYIDVYHIMLRPDGSPRPELFGPDNLHMNKAGYQLWQTIIAPYLLNK